jgi:hypothetical protein
MPIYAYVSLPFRRFDERQLKTPLVHSTLRQFVKPEVHDAVWPRPFERRSVANTNTNGEQQMLSSTRLQDNARIVERKNYKSKTQFFAESRLFYRAALRN